MVPTKDREKSPRESFAKSTPKIKQQDLRSSKPDLIREFSTASHLQSHRQLESHCQNLAVFYEGPEFRQPAKSWLNILTTPIEDVLVVLALLAGSLWFLSRAVF